jgi:hypothetical protein
MTVDFEEILENDEDDWEILIYQHDYIRQQEEIVFYSFCKIFCDW